MPTDQESVPPFLSPGAGGACPECFNEEYQNFQAGSLWTEKETQQMIQWLRDPNVEGLTLLGGEPMENAEGLAGVVRAVKAEISKSVWVYSGYLWEEILRDPLKKNLLELCDVLVDGPFINVAAGSEAAVPRFFQSACY